MNPIILSVVILEYNAEGDIYKCIASIERACGAVPHEIIISSNSCYPLQKQEKLKAKYSGVRWTFNAKNGGFSFGMNQGFKIAKGDYLLAMNLDAEILTPIDGMIRFLEEHPDVGAVGPQIVNSCGEIQDSCRPYVSIQSFFCRTFKRMIGTNKSGLSTDINYERTQTVDWIIGAFIMVRREIYQQTGGMDENYFMYAEDLDWCTRIRQLGFETVYYPKVRVVFEGSRNARHTSKYARIFFKSHIRFWKKFGYFKGYPKRQKKIY